MIIGGVPTATTEIINGSRGTGILPRGYVLLAWEFSGPILRNVRRIPVENSDARRAISASGPISVAPIAGVPCV